MLRINLLPKEYRPKPLVEFHRLVLLFFLVLFILGALGFSVREYYRYNLFRGELALLEEEFSLYGPSLQEIERMRAFKEMFGQEKEKINQVKALYQPVVELLYGVSEVFPENLWFTEIRIAPVNTVSLEGEALSLFSVGELLNGINHLPLCQNSRLKTITQHKDKMLTTFSFTIEFETGRSELEYTRN